MGLDRGVRKQYLHRMKFLLNKEERIKYLGFNDLCAVILGVPLLASVASLLFSAVGEEPTSNGIIWCFGLAMVHTIVYWALNRFWVIQLRMWMPRQEQTRRRILSMLLLALATVLIFETLSATVVSFFFPWMLSMGWGDAPVLFGIGVSLTLCILVLALYESAYFFVKYRQSLLEQERLARENMQAQLSVLKQQVNPHFLFNSLNTLVNIIPEDAQKATLFTQRLAAVYRRILEYRHRELISLKEEIAALGDYIFLMQTRFEDKLIIEWEHNGVARRQVPGDSRSAMDLPPYLRDYQIVPLAAQLLVENAIKHNVISRDHPLMVKITVDEDRLTIVNNLHLRERQLNSTGWGHHNIRRRYQLVTDQQVDITNDERSYRVSIPLIRPEIATRYATA